MELRHLRYFVAVADELHFGRAAARLHTSQPSLSQQIRDLERELKVDLFLRTKRRVALTSAGKRFVEEARAILSSAERAAGLAREAARGESLKLAVGISPETDWIFLGKALHLFGEHAPSVEVLFQNLTPEAQVDALRGGQIDVGFVGLPLAAEGMITEPTERVRLVAALPATHAMAGKTDLKLEELSKEAYVLWPKHLSPGAYDQMLSVFRRAGFGPPIEMEGGIPSTRTVLGMVAAGLTIALVDPVLEQMSASPVVFRPLAGPGIFTERGIIFRRGDASPLLASFLEEVRATSGEREIRKAVVTAAKRKSPRAAKGRAGAKR
ncbi:MAG TPA: LysR substrate-binding domain-containing protein [Thermoanaerobaculia bacterium]|nr:LysR substrate-binding domain-containing protein [Thermoanaerobaculia bacterium]